MAGDEGFPSRGFWLYWQAGAVSGFGSYITLLALQTLVVLTRNRVGLLATFTTAT